jgi:hypothetical protein
MVDQLKLFGVDRYVLTARLRPAFLTLLPLFLLAAIWLPKVWSMLGALFGLLIGCGCTVLLSQITRYRGRRVETSMGERAGRLNTTAALRHRDQRIDRATKARYHDVLRDAGRIVPTSDVEHVDPETADDAYGGCTTWLLEQTRDRKRFPLLADELIDYGFRRNMLGMKLFAIPILIGALIVDGLATYLQWAGFDTSFWSAVTLAVGLTLGLAAWIGMVNAGFVADASEAYTVRLLAACDSLAGAKGRARPHKRTAKAAEEA